MKVILINPRHSNGRYCQPPLGLLHVARSLSDVEIIDADAEHLGMTEVVRRAKDAGVVGVTATTPVIHQAMATIRAVKAANPAIFTVLGGPHASLLPERTMVACPELDMIVAGEADTLFPALLRAPKKGIYRSGATDWNLSLPYRMLPLSRYKPHAPHGRRTPWMPMITSRGCPYQCAFCSKPVFGSRFRAVRADDVVNEVGLLERDYGVREIGFYDDVFTLDHARVLRLCELWKQMCRSIWTCESRVDLVTPTLLKEMKRGGCYLIAYGLESGAPEILRTLQKRAGLAQAEQAISWTREAGIETLGYFIIGAPGETRETIRQTVDFAKRLKLDFAQFSLAMPFPGTKLAQMAEDMGLRVPGWSECRYEGTNRGVTFTSAELDEGAILDAISKAYREFYLRAGYVWQRVMKWHPLADAKGLRMLMERS